MTHPTSPLVELVARRLARRAFMILLADMLGEEPGLADLAEEVEREWPHYVEAAEMMLREATDPAVMRLDVGPDGRPAQVGVRV